MVSLVVKISVKTFSSTCHGSTPSSGSRQCRLRETVVMALVIEFLPPLWEVWIVFPASGSGPVLTKQAFVL